MSALQKFPAVVLAIFAWMTSAPGANAQLDSPEIRQAKRAVSAARSDLERGEALLSLGNTQLQYADLSSAKSSFDECIRITRNQKGTSAEHFQRELVGCLGMLGLVLWRQHNLKDLLAIRQEQVAVARKATLGSPNSTEWQDLLLSSFDDLCFALLQTGDNAAARSTADEAVGLGRKIASQRPGSGEAQFALHTALAKKAESLYEFGDTASAQASYIEDLNILSGLSAANPSSTEINHDYVITLVRVGDITKQTSYFEKALDIARAMQRRGILPADDADMISDIQSKLGGTLK
jgi:tetratricopeptide (TPR) repeat protein